MLVCKKNKLNLLRYVYSCKKSEKDYYDGVAGTMNIDKTIVYDR